MKVRFERKQAKQPKLENALSGEDVAATHLRNDRLRVAAAADGMRGQRRAAREHRRKLELHQRLRAARVLRDTREERERVTEHRPVGAARFAPRVRRRVRRRRHRRPVPELSARSEPHRQVAHNAA